MSKIDNLIYDRTYQDLVDGTDKAYISYTDLNRIEEAVAYLSDILNKYGYSNSTNSKTNWGIEEIRKQEDCDRIRENYSILKKAYAYKFELPDFNWGSIEEANRIEKILYDIDLLIKSMKKTFIYTGVSGLGQNRIWQNRFRRPEKSLGDGYTQIEYIESTKQQYIDTDYYVKYGDIVTIDFQVLDTQSYFGYYKSNTNRFGIGVARSIFEFVNGSNSSIWKPAADNLRHKLIIDTRGEMQLDDVVQIVNPMVTDFVAELSFTLFGRKQSATNVSYKGQHRVFGFSVENDGKLIKNLVPAKIDSDGTAGMCDTVSNKFYYNKGTGAFIAP